MFDYAIEIRGIAKDILHQSMTITETANGRNKMDIALLSPDGDFRPDLGDIITVEEEGVLIFSGKVQTPAEKGFGDIGGPDIVTNISAADANAKTEHRYFSGDIPAGDVLAALNVLVTYLQDVVVDPAQVNGPALPQLHYDFVSIKKILDEITALTNFTMVWDIDYLGQLKMFNPTTYPAPFALETDDGNAIGDITVEPTQDEYANRIIFRFNAVAKAAYSFLKLDANLVEDDEITIGSTTYTMKDAIDEDSNAHFVLIGADSDETLMNLMAAINVTDDDDNDATPPPGAGTIFGPATHSHATVTAEIFREFSVYHALTIKAKTAGENGNDIEVTSTNPDVVFYNEGDIERDTLWNGLDEETSEHVIAEDVAAQTAYGEIVEKVITDTDVYRYDIAQLKANAELGRALVTPLKITFTTDQRNVHPGMTLDVDVPERNISGPYIITDVVIKNITGGITRRFVTAYGGVSLPVLWQDYARRWFAGSGGNNSGGGSGGAIPGTGGGGTPMAAGAGLLLTGNTIDAVAADGIEVLDDSIGVKLDGTTLAKSPAGLRLTHEPVHEEMVGAVDNSNRVFTTTDANPRRLVPALNGLKLQPYMDYLVTGANQITLYYAPRTLPKRDRVTATYERPV